MNKYVGVPALKMGLGRYISNPLTGYLMILRTRGRKSGEMRDAPLGYTISGDCVYCIAGFGRRAYWYQNLLADPKVEAILRVVPSQAWPRRLRTPMSASGSCPAAAKHGRHRRHVWHGQSVAGPAGRDSRQM